MDAMIRVAAALRAFDNFSGFPSRAMARAIAFSGIALTGTPHPSVPRKADDKSHSPISESNSMTRRCTELSGSA
jgi:hypothetical protein